MKKIALLVTLILVFSLSCVFATDATILMAEPTATSGELTSGENTTTSVETSGESEETVNETSGENSGEISEVVSGETTNQPVVDDETETTKSNNSATIGAIIAIIIVIAVVAIAAILRKD